jgi:hypothetical protein
MLTLTKLPQAGMILNYRGTTVICDPLFASPVKDVFALPAGFGVDGKELGEYRFQGIFISHSHVDHFDPESLLLLNKECPVYYPAGAVNIHQQLMIMGFRETVAVKAGESYQVGEIEFHPIPSDVFFPEMGFIFRCGDQSVWNLVDANPKVADLSGLVEKVGRPDCLLAQYQCLNERGVSRYHMRTEFPREDYQQNLERVKVLRPRAVVPSSCDLYYAAEGWLNSHMFPVRRAQFLADINLCDASITGLALECGESAVIDEDGISPADSWGAIRPGKSALFVWRPDVAQYPVVDHSPVAREEITKFMAGTFERLLFEMAHLGLAEFKKHQVSWKLRLICTDGTELVYGYRFSPEKKVAAEDAGDWADIESLVGAGDLLAYARGELHPSVFYGNGFARQFYRFYRVSDWQVTTELGKVGQIFLPTLILEKTAAAFRVERLKDRAHKIG